MRSILDSTIAYETWLGKFTELWPDDLDFKHEQMADEDPFPFFRATYYRWAEHWQEAEEFQTAPIVPSVGDIHVENFGTWRDADGRLVWGVNDFDEADELPYVHDLVRLAASAWFAQPTLKVNLPRACELILDGYLQQLMAAGGGSKHGAVPFVLEEHHAALRELALNSDREPAKFWKKLKALPQKPAANPPADAVRDLQKLLPAGAQPEYRLKKQAGLGSLGKPRFVALVYWQGGMLAREAKALTPPATSWLAGTKAMHAAEVVEQAVRTADPFFRYGKKWVTRRLAPRCSRIELKQLEDKHSRTTLLTAMGAELANIHLGRPEQRKAVQKDLARRKIGWLKVAAESLAKKLKADWAEWREVY